MSKSVAEKKRSRSNLLTYLILIIIAGIIGVIIAGVKFFGTERDGRYASASIEFLYDGAAQNKTPNGEAFSIEGIYGDDIINAALEKCGLGGAYTAESVSNSMRVRGSYPGNIVSKIRAFDSLFDFSSSREVGVKEYYPTQYGITLNDDFDPEISSDKLEALCSAIAETYRDYFVASYVHVIDAYTWDELINVKDYDYAQQVKFYENSIQNLENFSRDLYARDSRYQLAGSSFNDVYQKFNILRTQTLRNVSAVITMDAVTTSVSRLRSQYEFEIKLLQNEKDSVAVNLTELDALIEKYGSEDVMYIGSANGVTRIDSNSAGTYEELQERRKEITNRIAEINNDISNYEELITDLDSAAALQSSASQKDVEAKLADISEKYDSYATLLQTMLADYNKGLISESDISISQIRSYEPKLISGGFIVKVIKCAGPLCVLMMILCAAHGMYIEIKRFKAAAKEM